MTIERIVKRSDESASVFFDDQGEMILSYEVIFKNGLRKGDAVSESLFYQLKNENEKYFIKKKSIKSNSEESSFFKRIADKTFAEEI